MTSTLQSLFFEPGPIVWVQQLFGHGHPLPFHLLALLASAWGVLFAVALGLWVWGRDDAYALACIVLLEAVVSMALNQVLSIPRPSDPSIVKYDRIALGSFPSGHVFTATALWGLLWARGRVPFWAAALVVLGVAVGRLYLGVHYLADVVAGAVLGVLLLRLFQALWPPMAAWLRARSYGWLAGAGLLAAAAALAGLLMIGAGNRYMVNAVVLAAAGVVALLAEYRLVRFTPPPPSRARTSGRVALGLLGLVPLVAVDRLTGEAPVWIGGVTIGLGALWALLLAPALFQRHDRGERGYAPPRSAADTTAGGATDH